ncbi:hypothetical protein EVAR_98398_1 [Eumeta japonica]|uniref:Uncharacterized protein n=1 Tax=Eumeta variegata TaxID=151549 RepID=A0A4C1XU39_EUMVA|nr:hypothetical protein EVAR_98398_1 [Eumeta japonica]
MGHFEEKDFDQAKELDEFKNLVTKMQLEAITASLSLIGLKWREVSRLIKNYNLPMSSASVARVLRKHLAKTSHYQEMDHVLAIFRLSFVVASESRLWHAVKMSEPLYEDQPISTLARLIPARVEKAASKFLRKLGSEIKVQEMKVGDFLYMSVRVNRLGGTRRSSEVFVASPPGEPVAFFSTMSQKKLIKAAVLGLGYNNYVDARLHGQDIVSLLRIIDRTWNKDMNNLVTIPEYNPGPVITKNGIDFTNQSYNNMYIDNLIGPNPPLLRDLDVRSIQPFFDSSILNEDMAVSLTIKSENVAETLKAMVKNRSLGPTSIMFQIFNETKSNTVVYRPDD